MFRGIKFLLAVAMLAPVSSAAQMKLLKAASDHFEIYTTESASAARAALEHFEMARAYLLKATGSQDPFFTPVRIFAFKSSGDFRASLPKGAEAEHAYSKGGDTSAFILMDGIGKGAYDYGTREYVDLLFQRAAPAMPFWLRLGFDEVYSTIQAKQGAVVVGKERVAYRAGSSPELSLSLMSVLMGLRPRDVKNQDKSRTAFESQNNANITTVAQDGTRIDLLGRDGGLPSTSGMGTIADSITVDYPLISKHLVSMLMFNKKYAAKFGTFVKALVSGEDSAATFSRVYGESLTGVAQDLAMDWRQTSHPVLTVKLALPNPVEPLVAALSADESAALLKRIKAAK